MNMSDEYAKFIQKHLETSLANKLAVKFNSRVFKWENSYLQARIISWDRRAYVHLTKPTYRGIEKKITLTFKELDGFSHILPKLRKEMDRCEEYIKKVCKEGLKEDEEKKTNQEKIVVISPLPLKKKLIYKEMMPNMGVTLKKSKCSPLSIIEEEKD